MSSHVPWNVAVALSVALASLPAIHASKHGQDVLIKNKFASLPATTSAEIRCVIPYPFEVVHNAWETGPQDVNFIREDKKETWCGSEMAVQKTIYTRNPFPFLIKKTVNHYFCPKIFFACPKYFFSCGLSATFAGDTRGAAGMVRGAEGQQATTLRIVRVLQQESGFNWYRIQESIYAR
jgi:hypothetical protein